MQHAGENSGIALSQLVEGNPVATIVIDAQHRVTHWNRACAVLTGVPAAEMIGSSDQWRAFYDTARPIMADLVVDGVLESGIDLYYHGKFSRSLLIDDAYEAEDFFPAFGEGGRWLFFTAAALRNAKARSSVPSRHCRTSPSGDGPRQRCVKRRPIWPRSSKAPRCRPW